MELVEFDALNAADVSALKNTLDKVVRNNAIRDKNIFGVRHDIDMWATELRDGLDILNTYPRLQESIRKIEADIRAIKAHVGITGSSKQRPRDATETTTLRLRVLDRVDPVAPTAPRRPGAGPC